MAEIALKNRMLRMKGSFSSEKVFLKNARVEEGLSKLTDTRIEFLSSDSALDMQDFIGTIITIELDEGESTKHYFSGTCISVEYIGLYQGLQHFVAELRPWLWFLTKARNNRIFQEMTAPDIITDVLGVHGFSGDVEKSLSGTYKSRTYCVQYRESDFDFICRLMEEEGIYYYFKSEDHKVKLVIADSVSAHNPIPKNAEIEFHFREEHYRRKNDHIFEWADGTWVTGGRVTIDDYDFTSPKKDLKAVKALPKGKHGHKDYKYYDYPGHIRTEGTGDTFARIKMEAEAVKHKLSRGVGNVRGLRAGATFKLKGHPRVAAGKNEFLVVNAVHLMQIETDYEDTETLNNPFNKGNSAEFGERNKDTYRCEFSVIPKSEPYRAAQSTPWPAIPGLHTAVVTGPSGEEIYTDEYGRIKVQFHWDRVGANDENTTCWVRVAMPWTGKNWGMIHIPRIGNEVVIQFEEGDPDRPICTGMLYNGENKPPYALPANMTQTGIVTRSSKQGSGSTFNELIFEDKKEAEFVRFQSERDYMQTIKNNATITIGLEHTDKGDLTQTIHRNKTETLNTGDHTFTVKAGNEVVKIKKDQTKTVEGKVTQTITDNYTQTIKMGNYARTIKMGNFKHDVKMGNHATKVNLGSITEDAMQKIEMKVGSSSIKIDQTGVTIKGLMIKIEGTAMLEAKAPMSTVKGDAILILKGGVTMIN